MTTGTDPDRATIVAFVIGRDGTRKSLADACTLVIQLADGTELDIEAASQAEQRGGVILSTNTIPPEPGAEHLLKQIVVRPGACNVVHIQIETLEATRTGHSGDGDGAPDFCV